MLFSQRSERATACTIQMQIVTDRRLNSTIRAKSVFPQIRCSHPQVDVPPAEPVRGTVGYQRITQAATDDVVVYGWIRSLFFFSAAERAIKHCRSSGYIRTMIKKMPAARGWIRSLQPRKHLSNKITLDSRRPVRAGQQEKRQEEEG